ncbi:MAG TPA: DUF1513 domain-containing protein [Limnobacter sp.]|nr:DUF1513 domain-containing protein [Limnobacter sp.]
MCRFSFLLPMAIDRAALRRRFLKQCAALGMVALAPTGPAAAGQAGVRMLAAWQVRSTREYQVGIVRLTPDGPKPIGQVVNMPTRPHGLMWLNAQTCVVIARRPGDWLMRIHWPSGQHQRVWLQGEHHLNGHALLAHDAPWLYTSETDLATGQGMLVQRHAQSFEIQAVWPTLGQDPHQMIALPAGVAGLKRPSILVANGGIPSHPDMGRAKVNLQAMDSSLVALCPQRGEVLGQWTLTDPRLSLRHLALHLPSNTVGVAMQAQHSEQVQRDAAPLLALLNASGLHVAGQTNRRQGYAGDVVATKGGFVVSCTLHHSACFTNPHGQVIDEQWWPDACALAAQGDRWWLGHSGSDWPLQLDNHWQAAEM